MPLVGYQQERRTIALSGGNSFTVRGLSLSDLSVLIREYYEDLSTLVDLFDGTKMTMQDWSPIVLPLVSQAPGLSASIIALASDEGTAAIPSILQLPAPVQIKALTDIGDLTFTEVGGVGKAVELVAGLLKKTQMDQKAKTIKRKTA